MTIPDRVAEIAALLAQLAHLTMDQHPPEPSVARPMPDRVLLTVEEAAARLRIGRTNAYALVRTGQLASVLIGRLRRIPAEAVAEYAARLVADQNPTAA